MALAGNSQAGTLRDSGAALFDTGFRNIGIRPTGEDLGVGGTTPFGTPLNFSRPDHPGQTAAVDGAFKVPGLRNVELTGPYFHNGGKASLEQVMDFYHKRGDFRMLNRIGIDRELELIRLSGPDRVALAAFLRNGLTDDRVRFEKAPFDHPELRLPNGHLPGGADNLVTAPAVGAAGRQAEGLPPLKPFLQ